MQRIKGQLSEEEELAKQVLSWITCATRPLTMSELQHALAVEIEESNFDETNIIPVEDMVSVCAGLVTTEEESGIISLVHYTAQEYFDRTRSDWFPDAEAEITATCATYLSFNEFESGPCATDDEFEERLRSYRLYDYAVHNWDCHAHKASTIRPVVIDFLESRLKVEAACQGLMAIKIYSEHSNYSQEFPTQMTGLHLAAYLGVTEAISALLERGAHIDSKDKYDRTPLSYAVEEGHEAIVKLLLAEKVDADARDEERRTPLSYATDIGNEAIIKLFSASIKAPNVHGE